MELQGPQSDQTALAYWNEAGDIKAVTPPLPSSPRTDGGASSDSTSDEENNNTDVDTTAGDVNLGARAPVTPEWPRRRGNAASSSRIWGTWLRIPTYTGEGGNQLGRSKASYNGVPKGKDGDSMRQGQGNNADPSERHSELVKTQIHPSTA